MWKGYGISVQTQIIPSVDRILEQMEGVISGDAMAVSVYMTPEELWGYDLVTSAYKETPETSRERIYRHVMEQYPNVSEKQIKTLMK